MPDERPAIARDRAYMRRALALARRGWGWTAPNPMVGAVVVRENRVVGEGWHERYGERHAEPAALQAAGDLAREATLYVTLEPCSHQGQTPPCVNAILDAGVRRVVIAARDPNPVAGGGAERLRAAGIEVEIGVGEEDARELNAPFFHSFGSKRPWVVLKLAMTIDSAIADSSGTSRWITGAAARREVHRLRAGHDAIGVGVETVITDDPSLTVRGKRVPRVAPARVVFDRNARTPLGSKLVKSAREVRTIVVTAPGTDRARTAALTQAGVTLVEAKDIAAALEALRENSIGSILVEGGARLGSALLNEALVDRLIIFRAPLLLGKGALNAFAEVSGVELARGRRFSPIVRRRLGDDMMTVYARGEEECSPG